MITLSLCMIVKNEEKVLARCLQSAGGIADEIIIVDTGSEDRTIEIAKSFTDHVYSFEWQDDFSAARNFSFSKATMEYILWLDADDVIDGENRARFLALKETLSPDVGGVMLPYHVSFDSAGKPTFSYYRERIVRRENGARWKEPVHEHLTMSGKIVNMDAAVSHRPGPRPAAHSDRNLRIYRKRLEEGEVLSTRGMYYFARELKTHGLWDEAVAQYTEVLKKQDLWLEDAITASGDLADCYRQVGQDAKALETLFSSFRYDLPRAEILCRIGEHYARAGDNTKAIFWYDLIFSLPKPGGWGFFTQDCWDYIPHMQLCMLYDRVKNFPKALEHHNAAKALRPDNAAVLHNEEYFKKLQD